MFFEGEEYLQPIGALDGVVGLSRSAVILVVTERISFNALREGK